MKRFGLQSIVVLALATTAGANEIAFWNNQLLDSVRAAGTPPPRASRAMAMVHLAMYDAVNSIAQTHRSYVYTGIEDPFCSKEAAAAKAAFETLKSLYPSREAIFQTALDNRLSMITDGQAKTLGIAAGGHAANAMLVARTNDGSGLIADPYLGGNNPGQWRPTPTGFAPGLLPRWREVTPFGMTSASQFRMGPPPSLTSDEYTSAYNEVKRMGRATGSDRTADQTEIALFWADGGGTATPPGHWFRIAQTVGEAQNLGIAESARLFALLGMAVADAGIACWDMKYEYSFWRPVTAIREGDNDTNPDTVGDAAWTSLIATPPFPTYTSGHSTFSGSAAEILGQFFGTDDIAFSSQGEGLTTVTRNFTGFMQAANEAADSRLYGGIHYRFDNQVGLDMGVGLGDYLYQNHLTAVPEPSTLAVFGLLGLGLLVRRKKS
ncbi:MAG TPA: phosphatase PAP2 family protein [Fimbriimonadaceae bacterium]|nr:phosphatase PAP2 family protein [Fimbriimonadaceae bacterium]